MPVAAATPFEYLVAVVVLLLPVAAVPGLWSPTFTPKLAVLGILLALGMPRLVALLRPGPHALAARALVAFLAVALASALSSKSPLVGLFGLYQWGIGWFFWCAVAACFALGATIGEAGRRRLADAVTAAALFDALVAVAQSAGDVSQGWLRLYQGTQADGLLANPVYLEALCIGALALVCWRCAAEDARWGLAAPLLAAAEQLSHERLAVALFAAVLVATILRFRSRRAVGVAVAALAGYVATWAAAGVLTRGPLSGAVDVAGTPRVAAWKLLVRGVPHHLLLGVGPGQTRSAFFSEETLSTVRRLGENFYFADAHDIVLEVLVTTGVLGVVALLGFLAGVLHDRPRGPFLWFAAAVLAVELVEPLEIVVVPLAALSLGAALPSLQSRGETSPCADGTLARRDWAASPAWRAGGLAARVVLAGASLSVAVVLLVGDWQLGSGLSALDRAAAVASSRLLPIWADTASAVATVDQVLAERSGATRWLAKARAAEVVATARDPGDPLLWASLGATDLQLGAPRAARTDYGQAHVLWPWWTQALMGLGTATRKASGSCAAARVFFELAEQSAPQDAAAREALRRCTSGSLAGARNS